MLSQRLKSARNRLKLTQEVLANKVNTTKATISNYENGHSTPSNEMLVLLSDVLEISTDYLLGKTDKMEPLQVVQPTADKEFEAFANDPELERWYKDLPNSEEEDLQSLKQMWEIIRKNKK